MKLKKNITKNHQDCTALHQNPNEIKIRDEATNEQSDVKFAKISVFSSFLYLHIIVITSLKETNGKFSTTNFVSKVKCFLNY